MRWCLGTGRTAQPLPPQRGRLGRRNLANASRGRLEVLFPRSRAAHDEVFPPGPGASSPARCASTMLPAFRGVKVVIVCTEVKRTMLRPGGHVLEGFFAGRNEQSCRARFASARGVAPAVMEQGGVVAADEARPSDRSWPQASRARSRPAHCAVLRETTDRWDIGLLLSVKATEHRENLCPRLPSPQLRKRGTWIVGVPREFAWPA